MFSFNFFLFVLRIAVSKYYSLAIIRKWSWLISHASFLIIPYVIVSANYAILMY